LQETDPEPPVFTFQTARYPHNTGKYSEPSTSLVWKKGAIYQQGLGLDWFKSLLETDTVGAKLPSLVSCGKGVEQKSVACPRTIHLAAGLVPNLDEESI